MSGPPKYQPVPTGDGITEDDERYPETAPSYPPTSRHIFTMGDGGPSNVIYTFVPRYPLKGEPQDALGVLGRDKHNTVLIVQRGFPTLAEYPPERIEFLAPVEVDSNGRVVDDRWGTVMEEAWSRFDRDPPSRLRVQVVDLPGDAEDREVFLRTEQEARDWKEAQAFLTFVAFAITLVAVVTLIIWYNGGFETSGKSQPTS
ncbi:hypothetical protein BCR39DRAFT_505998 [Naematelia encephala]|uniref:Uncharacterized protein n=1 Tax=Naematelia encephala TaxID=71784 RepID=A0A1Y2B058_9TREE|nr:hypothetical protein BCR39DRAFT_505998 [Naematelia encephala]